MSNIPKLRFPEFSGDWEEKKLGECVNVLDSQRKPIESKERANRQGIYPYYGASGIIDFIDDYLFEGESVLLSEDGANIINRNSRLAFLASGRYWVNNHAHIMRANDDNINYFICEYLENLDYSKICAGSAQPKLTQDVIRNLVIKKPCKTEQQKIADFLSNVDSIIAAETKFLNTLQKKKKALMQKLFTQQLRFKSADGTDFPEWEEKKMSDICSVNQGLQIAIENRLLEKKANCYFYITNEFIKTGTKYKYYIENPPKNVLCTKDDILMTRTGNTGIVVTDIDGCFHNNFFKINYSRDLVIKGFLVQFFKLSTTQKRILVLAGSSTIPDLNHKDFYSLTIQLPCKAEQQKIADCLSSMDSLIQTQQKVVTTWQQRKKALLQQMFI